jgi:hypothetical protein
LEGSGENIVDNMLLISVGIDKASPGSTEGSAGTVNSNMLLMSVGIDKAGLGCIEGSSGETCARVYPESTSLELTFADLLVMGVNGVLFYKNVRL